MTPEAIQNLPATETRLAPYSKEPLARLRTAVAMARFPKGASVRVAWCKFYDMNK